jgi:hypothetical protein
MKVSLLPRESSRLISASALSLLLSTSALSAADTTFTEDFSSPSKLANSGATAELGNGGSYSYGHMGLFQRK